MKANILFQWILRVLLILAVLGNFLPLQNQVVLASPVFLSTDTVGFRGESWSPIYTEGTNSLTPEVQETILPEPEAQTYKEDMVFSTENSQSATVQDLCSPGTGWTWTTGSSRPEIAEQAKLALSQGGIESEVIVNDYGEADSCGNFELFSVDFSVDIKSDFSSELSAQGELGDRVLQILSTVDTPQLGNVEITFASGDTKLYQGSTNTQELAATSDLYANSAPAFNKKVFLLVYDPILSNGQRLNTYMGWASYDTLAQGVVSSFLTASHGQLQYEIPYTVVLDEWAVKINGFRYTETTFLDDYNKHTPTNLTWLNYDAIIDDPRFDLCNKLNNGEIDEVWIYGPPYDGSYESRLVGPGAYWYNSPPVDGTHNCNRLLPIMGLNYERGVAEALHSFGHRTESTMEMAYGGWLQNRTSHNWDRFGLDKAQSPNYSYSGCGSIHYPPNGMLDYDYDRLNNPTLTNCEDFKNYPNLNTNPLSVAQSVTCTTWNCNQYGFLMYWYSHLPSTVGCGSDLKASNWWKYFADPNLSLNPSSPCIATPTVTVTNTNDSGTGSLREALAIVSPGGTITFASGLSGSTIYLATTLILAQDVTIDGSALTSQITISGDTDNNGTGNVRVFYVNSGVIATLNSLIIKKGISPLGSGGGGIFSYGSMLTVMNSTFFGNFAEVGYGGGIYGNGDMTVMNSTFSDNSATTSGDMGGGGGGIYYWGGGTLTVTNSTFSGNSAVSGSSILNSASTLTVMDSTFSGNSASYYGAGIHNNTGTLTITNSTFFGNSASYGGGGVYSRGGMLNITNSLILSNSAAAGGGIYNGSGTLAVSNSTFSGNTATNNGINIYHNGGGIYNNIGGTLNITNSTFSDNSAIGDGGGIANYSTMAVTNSTFSDNSATWGGGGIYNSSVLTVTNSTLSGNSASNSGGGIRNDGTLNYANTIIANSSSEGDCSSVAIIGTNTNNLVEDGSCSASLSGDPNLDLLLADNGGATQTIALLAGSSAIDTGNTAICAAAPVSGLDQRGASRSGTYCDIGAYEHLTMPAYTIGGTGDDVGKDIAVDSNGNTYIVGYSTAIWGIPIQAFNGGIYGNDTFVAKLDSSGNLLWNTFLQKRKGFNEVYSIGVDGSGNVYISGVGTSGSTFLVKLSANGNLLWNIPVAGGSFFSDMAVTANGTAYIAGSSLYAYAIKVDTNGNQLWNTSLGRSDNDCKTGIAVDTSGNAYVTSCSHEVGYLDAFVTKLDINGNLIWNAFLGATGSSMTGSDIAIDASRNIYVFGASDSSWGTPLQPFSNSSPYFIAKLNQSGNLQWNTFIDLWGSDITTDMSGKVHVAGLDSGAILDTNGNFTLIPLLQGSGITTDSNNIYTTGSEDAPSDVFIHKIGLSQDFFPPSVASITRVSGPATSAANVDFTVTFSEIVTGVDVSDFTLTTTGVSSPTVSGVNGSGSSYTVSVNTGSSNGTLRLNLLDNNSIIDAAANSLAAGFTKGETYTVIKAATFGDVPLAYWASGYIERLFNAGITGGCGTGIYCPDNTVTRAQMAVFLLKGMHGSSFSPPGINGSTGFGDVATNYWAAAWIKQLAAEGITGGCGNSNYCPDATVTRAQMAIFLLKAKHGSSYSPPNAIGVFTDVSVGYWADKWIEQLAAEGVTSGCGTGIYCPDASVTRAQMAVFLVKAFGLP